MNELQAEPRIVEAEAQLSGRLWQQWQWKNRERDRIGARNRLRFLKVLLAVVFLVALVQSYILRR